MIHCETLKIFNENISPKIFDTTTVYVRLNNASVCNSVYLSSANTRSSHTRYTKKFSGGRFYLVTGYHHVSSGGLEIGCYIVIRCATWSVVFPKILHKIGINNMGYKARIRKQRLCCMLFFVCLYPHL